MTKYEIIFEALQEKVNSGELTFEDASTLNDMAYEKYVVEASDNSKDLELIDELRGLVEAGKVKLDKDCKECIEDLIEDAKEDEEEDKKEDKADAEEPAEADAGAEETPAE